MKDITNLNLGWLGELPTELAEKIVEFGRWVHLEKGELVYSHDEAGTDLFGISSGVARLQIAMNEHEQRVAHVIGQGFWFGEYAFISGSSRMIEVEAASKMLVLRISRRNFQRIVDEHPDVWRWIALLTCQHYLLTMGASDDLMLPSSEKRLIAVLLRMSGHRLNHPKSPSTETVPITQGELAVAANLSRATAGRILRKLENQGDISIEYGSFKIRDANALQVVLV